MLWMCLVVPTSDQTSKIFGFAEFVQAFALLVVIYTFSDARYRFRISTAPINLRLWTFIACGVIGFGTLSTDLWFYRRLPIPTFLNDQLLWQTAFGTFFLGIVLLWLWYAFMRRPIFGKRNYLNYARTFYSYILQGSDSELPIIAAELMYSARSIVTFAKTLPYRGEPNENDDTINPGQVANEIMLLMGGRKFCRHVVASSPGTAIAFFEEMKIQNKYRIAINQFASNVSAEAIRNKDSQLYHEDEGYYSGFLGYTKPFSKALYGNWQLVEALAQSNSPLDVRYETLSSWDASQVKAYCRAVLITFESYLECGAWPEHSYSLYRAFDEIESSCIDLSNIDGITEYYKLFEYQRLKEVLTFVKNAIALLEKYKPAPRKLRRRGDRQPFQEDYYDLIANMMFELILKAGYIKGPPETCWGIQHNTIWDTIFSLHDGEALNIVRFKLRRLLYEEILHLETFPNFKSSRILGFCLATMGLVIGTKANFGRNEFALRKAVINWTKKNFLSLHKAQPFVAETCLLGAISFEEAEHQLVKTYARNLDLTPHREILKLDPVNMGKVKPRKARNKSASESKSIVITVSKAKAGKQ